MPAPKLTEEVKEHQHRWIQNKADGFPYCDQPYKGHNCHALRVTPEQLDQITKEWNSYYELVKTTDAYLDYLEMKVATKYGDRDKIAEIRARVFSRNKVVKNEYSEDVLEPIDPLPKPNYPDPIHASSLYVVEGKYV